MASHRSAVTPDVAAGALSLDGIVLEDAITGQPFDLGTGPPLALLSIIRHRY